MPLTPEEVDALAAKPAAASGDTGSRTNRSADDLIKLDQYAEAKAAAAEADAAGAGVSGFSMLRPTRLRPGSALG